MTRPQIRDKEYHWINFWGTRGTPAGQGFDRKLRIRVPLCSHRSADGESGDRVWLTGQEKEGRLPRTGINLVLDILI